MPFSQISVMGLSGVFCRGGEPALVLRQALFFAKRYVVALEKAVDRFAILFQDLDNEGEERVLDLFHAERKRLRDEQVFKPVDRQAGKASASPKIRRQQPVCPFMTALR